jgi:hypothetical protein
MPRQTSSRSTPRTTPAPTNGDRKPNGRRAATRNGGNGNDKPTTAWPVELVLAAEVELSIEGKDASVDGFAVCSRCAALLPGSEISRALHARFHELVDGIDQRAG